MYCTGNRQSVSLMKLSSSVYLVTILRSHGSQVSAEHIFSYQTTISATVKALEERLTEMNDKLESLPKEICQNIVSNHVISLNQP